MLSCAVDDVCRRSGGQLSSFQGAEIYATNV